MGTRNARMSTLKAVADALGSGLLDIAEYVAPGEVAQVAEAAK